MADLFLLNILSPNWNVILGERSNTITFVVGPTAAGKTQFAIDSALQNNGIIINGDSLQVFKHLDIGTAKPSLAEREICPHFLFDIVDVGQEFTAGEYRRAALKVIEENIEKHNIYIVGGSGFYLQALEKGMFNVEAVPESVVNNVENLLTDKGNQYVWDELKKNDPASAENIHVNDSYRLVRALSVVLHTGKAWSQLKKEFTDKEETLSQRYTVNKVGLSVDREALRKRVEIRTQQMFDKGLIEEVRAVLKLTSETWPPLQSVGYRETLQFLRGELSEEELIPAIIQSTMRLAKKQMTWFKRDTEVDWRYISAL